MESGKTQTIATGLELLGGLDHKDEWIYGGIKDPNRTPMFRPARARLGANGGGLQELSETTGTQWVTNPEHPIFFTRHDSWGNPFAPTVLWWDLDGTHRRPGMLVLEAAHMAWQGNGEHFLIGDGIARGRRWDEPAPSNVHVLAAGQAGNLSACGRSGRFAVSDSAIFDLRSGDTWPYRYFLSPQLKATKEFYATFDGEAKGSPDGTKVAFTVRYDMEKGAVTELTAPLRAGDQALRVKSTDGFPPSGVIVIWTEAIGYRSKTSTSFEGLTRGLHGTRTMDGAAPGRAVTDFNHHLLTEPEWEKVTAVPNEVRLGTNPTSVLLRQRGRDVYVAVVRRPDRPWLHTDGSTVFLVPGESSYETAGYHLLLNGRRITNRLLRTGEKLTLPSPGEYAAIAVEWSGVESEPGNVAHISLASQLQVLGEAPSGFRWTRDRWLVGEQEIPPDRAAKSASSRREVIHRYDGVIACEWHEHGALLQHHDLNQEGKAIRRLTYDGGKIALRDYHNRDDQHTSRQVFSPDGHITETIHFGQSGGQKVEIDHWWFNHGTPFRRITGGLQYLKQGEQWKPEPYRP